MFLWLFVAVLGLVFLGLAAYSLPASQGALQPGSDFMLGLMAQIGGMIVEVIAIVKLSAYFADRKWQPVRDQIRSIIWADLRNVIRYASGWPNRQGGTADPGAAVRRIVSDLQEMQVYLDDNSVRENVQFMTAGFTPELAAHIGNYLTNRGSLRYYISRTLNNFHLLAGKEDFVNLPRDRGNLAVERLVLLVAREDSEFAKICGVISNVSANTVEEGWDLLDTLNQMVSAATAIDPKLNDDYTVKRHMEYLLPHAGYLRERAKEIREKLDNVGALGT